MSKKCKGDYQFRGFLVRFNEAEQIWYAEPNYLLTKYGDSDIVINFIMNNQHRIEPKKTIPKMKYEISYAISGGIMTTLERELEEKING